MKKLIEIMNKKWNKKEEVINVKERQKKSVIKRIGKQKKKKLLAFQWSVKTGQEIL